jgi:hypothetical protein
VGVDSGRGIPLRASASSGGGHVARQQISGPNRKGHIPVLDDPLSSTIFIASPLWIAGLLAVAWTMMNVLQLLRAYEPALGISPRTPPNGKQNRGHSSQPSTAWSVAMVVIAAAGILSQRQLTTFLYWQF